MSRNPRPCFWCRQPESRHGNWPGSHRYMREPRTEPLRAKRQTPRFDALLGQLEDDPSMGLLVERNGEAVAVIISWESYAHASRELDRLDALLADGS